MEQVMEYAQKLAEYDGDKLISSGLSLRLSGGGSGVGEKFWMYLFPNGGTIIEKTPSGKWHNGYNNEAGRKTVLMYLDLSGNTKLTATKSSTTPKRLSWTNGDVCP
jgi:multiple sugar transport system substrate-binding protein